MGEYQPKRKVNFRNGSKSNSSFFKSNTGFLTMTASILKYVIKKHLTIILKKCDEILLKILEILNPLVRYKVVSLKPDGPVRGHVLLSYRIELFLIKPGQPIPHYHYDRQLSVIMAQAFVDLGFTVDVISNYNDRFLPKKKYSLFMNSRRNFERIAPLLDKDCIKIFLATNSHPHFVNFAETKRLLELQERRHVTLDAKRNMAPNFARAIEHADCIMALSEFSKKCFQYARKPIYLLPNAVPFNYHWPDSKDFNACRSRFLWLGNEGLVHKGLDLVLEAFVGMPEYHLTVCGPVVQEKDFEQAYFQELYHTPNIHTYGWINVETAEFTELVNRCIGLVFPSSSETSSGTVLTCMHAGLIPIISYEAAVDIGKDEGVLLDDCSIDSIQLAVRQISTRSARDLREMSRKAWEFARANHTMENFEKEYKKTIEKIIGDFEMAKIGADGLRNNLGSSGIECGYKGETLHQKVEFSAN